MSKKPSSPLTPLSPYFSGLLLLLIAFCLTCSFASYNNRDPHANWFGLFGHLLGWIANYLLGLASWPIPLFLGWIGWRHLKKDPPARLAWRTGCLALALCCFAILLAMVAEIAGGTGAKSLLKQWLYSDSFPRKLHLSNSATRSYLGGVPFHRVYTDLDWNLRTLLGTLGTATLFSSLLLISLFFLLEPSFEKLWKFFSKLKTPKENCPGPMPFSAEPPLEKVSDKIEQDIAPKRPLSLKLQPLEKVEEPLALLSRRDPLRTEAEAIKLPSTPLPERQEMRQAAVEEIPLPPLFKEGNYQLPPLNLFTEIKPLEISSLKNDLKRLALVLEETLLSFGIEAKVGDIHSGPTITSLEVHPAVGVKVQKIKTLENDIALNMQAKSVRIVAPIPGKAAVGIEIPNPYPQEVSFRELLEIYQRSSKKATIPLLLGKLVNGDPLWSDLTKMPHLIIAGATGSGKSVCINTIVLSIIANASPEEIKLVMVDPKKVELTAYTRLPHMLAPVITESGGACAALAWLVKEMERRYEVLRKLGLRNIQMFNSRQINRDLESALNLDITDKMSFIVVIIDELADLMMVSASDIETPIARIAQMARAVGIHLILATQRPSREVITGLIKANFPCRIAFKVSSRVNSQIIIDDNGAEVLLGNGDLLFLPPGSATLVRAQGAFIRDEDINRVIDFCCSQAATHYLIPSFDAYREWGDGHKEGDLLSQDPLYEEARRLVLETGSASTTFLQRKMKLGYARAASLMDQLEAGGVVGPSEGAKPRKIFYPQEDME